MANSPFDTRSTPSAPVQATAPPLPRPVADQQNFVVAVLAGTVAAAVGAGLWALITILTHFQIGFMAVGVGFLVGWTVRGFGRGSAAIYSWTGAILALVGCVAGNLLTACIFASQEMSVALFDVLGRLTPEIATQLMTETFHPMDVLFYALAVYQGYRFSVVDSAGG
jgi:hypothetical protein